ncbi:hypothetical protein QJS66_10560 [Kocuria rhizophila]|nr:hypothetical protein QJS66_10560 [Kocuria rhizophila]
MHRLLGMGVDRLITDRADLLRRCWRNAASGHRTRQTMTSTGTTRNIDGLVVQPAPSPPPERAADGLGTGQCRHRLTDTPACGPSSTGCVARPGRGIRRATAGLSRLRGVATRGPRTARLTVRAPAAR